MRGPAGAGESRRGGTGDGGRGETGSAGSEERRVRSERRGPDIRRPLDVRNPVCQSAGRGEMRRQRSSLCHLWSLESWNSMRMNTALKSKSDLGPSRLDKTSSPHPLREVRHISWLSWSQWRRRWRSCQTLSWHPSLDRPLFDACLLC